MSNTQEQLRQVEINIDEAKEAISNMESVIELHNNRHFKKIVDEGYFQQEAARLVLALADANLQSEEHQQDLNKAIRAVGEFRNYLGAIIQLGRTAENALAADEQTREELLAEELQHG